MPNQPFDIDSIVRQVLADLSARGALPVAANATPAIALPQTVGHEKATLQLLDTLVTLASLEGRLDGVREVVISPKAIVTPSVRDLLYKKEIRLQSSEFRVQSSECEAKDKKHSQPDKTTEVWVALHQLKREPETLLNFLQGQAGKGALQPATVVKESFSCIIETTQTASKRLAESDAMRAIIVTNHSAAALVAANRHVAIRAINGENTEQTSQDAAMVGANLLVLHADRLGAWRMKEIARVFLANPKRDCPDFLSGRAVTEREKSTRNT